MASPIVSAAWYAAITTENVGTGPGWSPGSGAGGEVTTLPGPRLALLRGRPDAALSSESMSLRRTDLRLVLPEPAWTAAVLGDLGAWQAGLAAAGVETASGSNPADLAVAPGALARRAATAGAPAVLLEGRRGARVLRRAGYAVRRFLVLPDLDHPSLVLPLAPGGAARYALETWRPAHTAGKRFRNRAVGTLAESGATRPSGWRRCSVFGILGRPTRSLTPAPSASRRSQHGSSRSDKAILWPASPSICSPRARPSLPGC